MLTTQEVSERLKIFGVMLTADEVAELARKGVLHNSEKRSGIWRIPEESVSIFAKQMRRKRKLKIVSIGGAIITVMLFFFSATSGIKDGVDFVVTYLSSKPTPSARDQLPPYRLISNNGLLRINHFLDDPCTRPAIIPTDYNTKAQPESSAIKVQKAYESGLWQTWPKAPKSLGISGQGVALGFGFDVPFQVTNVTRDGENIAIGRNFKVTIQATSVLSMPYDVVHSCQGSGEIHSSSDIASLNLQKEHYELLERFEADYYYLEPGEFEVFSIKLKCSEPGTYLVNVEIPYLYKGSQGVIQFPQQEYICPTFFTYWVPDTYDIWSFRSQAFSYKWKNDNYQH